MIFTRFLATSPQIQPVNEPDFYFLSQSVHDGYTIFTRSLLELRVAYDGSYISQKIKDKPKRKQ